MLARQSNFGSTKEAISIFRSKTFFRDTYHLSLDMKARNKPEARSD